MRYNFYIQFLNFFRKHDTFIPLVVSPCWISDVPRIYDPSLPSQRKENFQIPANSNRKILKQNMKAQPTEFIKRPAGKLDAVKINLLSVYGE